MKSAESLKLIFNRIDVEPPAQWPVDDLCRSIAILKQALLDSKKPRADYIIGGTSTLRTLLRAKSLSRAWQDHCLHGSSRLGILLAERIPPDQFVETWKSMTNAERFQFSNDVVALQSRTLSLPGANFIPTKVKIGNSHGDKALFTWNRNHIADVSRTQIVLDKKEIKIANFDTITTIWHEQLHAIMHQLASHYQKQTIAHDHPFYEDARLMYYRILHHAHGIIDLGETIYNADTEEALCMKSEKHLARHYRNPDFSRRI